jgi:spore coat protein U-like protein
MTTIRLPVSGAAAALALATSLLPVEAHAETGKSFQVSATIQPGCLVDGLGASGNAGSIGTLNFGTASSLSTATRTASLSATQSIRLRCTAGVQLHISIDGGAHANLGVRRLQLGNTTARLDYSVCEDAACTKPFGVSVVRNITIAAGDTEDVRLPIFGSLTLPGNKPAGTYSDTLTVTLSW